MKYFIALFAFGLGFGLSKMDAVAQSSKLPSVSAKQLAKKIDQGLEMTILDVRTHGELIEGTISNAKHLDFKSDDFEQRLSSLDKSKTYFVYSNNGNRSARTVEMMRALGFSNVYNVKGGMAAWRDKGKPLKRMEQ